MGGIFYSQKKINKNTSLVFFMSEASKKNKGGIFINFFVSKNTSPFFGVNRCGTIIPLSYTTNIKNRNGPKTLL